MTGVRLTDADKERIMAGIAHLPCKEAGICQEPDPFDVIEAWGAARVAEALRDAAASFRLGKNESLHWYTVAERLDNKAAGYERGTDD